MSSSNNPYIFDNVPDQAEDYADRGFSPIPYHRGSKAPKYNDWQYLCIDKEEVGDYFCRNPFE